MNVTGRGRQAGIFQDTCTRVFSFVFMSGWWGWGGGGAEKIKASESRAGPVAGVEGAQMIAALLWPNK